MAFLKVLNEYFQYAGAYGVIAGQVIDIESMFGGCKNLIRLNMRNATFNATNYLLMFNAVPNGITITVKDNTAKTWIEARLREVNKTGNVIIG